MIENSEIKTGLHFQIGQLENQSSNTSFLTRGQDKILLTCIFSGLDCNLDFGDDKISHELSFTFFNSYLQGFSSASDNFSASVFPEYQQHDICCNTQMILHDIINTKLLGTFRNMFLESKALALLLCFQKCNAIAQTTCETCKFLTKPIEKEKIIKAREILLKNLNSPPTAQELSMEIGINQCYLKKGFKELFGTTVYDFIQEQRMLKARLLLSTSNFSVSEVAEQVGFSSQSNFSSAFKKFTGVTPSELQQN